MVEGFGMYSLLLNWRRRNSELEDWDLLLLVAGALICASDHTTEAFFCQKRGRLVGRSLKL